jgi:hypothetical protein
MRVIEKVKIDIPYYAIHDKLLWIEVSADIFG